MTKSLRLLLLTIVLFSCNQKEPTKYYWVSFHGHEYNKGDTTQIIHFDKTESGDTTKWDYKSKYGDLTYYIINNRDSSFIISKPKDSLIHSNDNIVFMRNFHDTSLILTQDTFHVKEFILDEFVTDGASIYYYTPLLGIYAGHSNTWPGIRYLQTNDTTINKQIDYLIKATVPKFFIRDTLEQILK
jgi:hypothetical protein